MKYIDRMRKSAGIITDKELMEQEEAFMVCDACGKRFTDKKKYDNHMKACKYRTGKKDAVKEREDDHGVSYSVINGKIKKL